MIVMISSFAAAVQKPVLQQADSSAQLVISAQDVITASDAGGGLSSRDLLIIATIGVVILVVALVL
jgi:hypothetical protein